jgi:predicted RNase H-like nuclease (RuvC/YqgF family)
MELQSLRDLESRIVHTLEMMRRLQKENSELRNTVQELKQRLEAKERELAEVSERLEHELNNKFDDDFYKKREAYIRQEIESMIAKLDSLESPL